MVYQVLGLGKYGFFFIIEISKDQNPPVYLDYLVKCLYKGNIKKRPKKRIKKRFQKSIIQSMDDINFNRLTGAQ